MGDTAQPPQLPPGQSPAQVLAMIDFGIGQERELDIAFKYQDEAECFGMSNETYQYKDWKHQQKLVQENIKARVRLRGVNVDSTWDFWFQNPKSAGLQKLKFQNSQANSHLTDINGHIMYMRDIFREEAP
jgi:hypothetical protein